MQILDWVILFGRELLSLTLVVLPYFLLGAVAGASLEVFLKQETALKYLGKGVGSVFNASLLGAILPGCSCATMPMAAGMKVNGARLGTIAAFILVSPLLSPHTLLLNYGLLGWKFTAARIVVALVGAVALGLLFNYLEARGMTGFAPETKLTAKEPHDCERLSGQQKNFWRSLSGIVRELGKYFLLGMVIATGMTVLIPEEAIGAYLGSTGPFAYAAAVLVGIPLYVCEGEEIPITLALLKLGLGPGPSFAFLLGSVGTCIPTMIMAPKIIGRRPTGLYVVSWFGFAIGTGLLFQWWHGAWAG